MIAALFVERNGVYADHPNTALWPQERDARKYDGPWPVVAHPPCSTWCQLAYVNQARYGRMVGADEGCFRAALTAVRRFGGVLEHPKGSHAWQRFRLPLPKMESWQRYQPPESGPFWVTEVAQGAYGHRALKLTWLLYSGTLEPPTLDWWAPLRPRAMVSYLRNHGGRALYRLPKKEAKSTPLPFRDLLISLAEHSRLL